MTRPLGALSRAINRLIPGSLPGESLCGRACREFGSDALICRVLDAFCGEFHCLDEMIATLKELRKK